MTTYIYKNPRDLDGTPYEVAAAAVRQAEAAAKLLEHALLDARVMARNADMERQLAIRGEADVVAWNKSSAQGAMLSALVEQAEAAQKKLNTLAVAVAYDPKHPPK